MCQSCINIDKQIEHYPELLRLTTESCRGYFDDRDK
jgi:hypothetical protein